MSDEQLTIDDVLTIILNRAQKCREEGESDMRNVIYAVSSLRSDIKEGKPRQEVIDSWSEDSDD